MSLSLSLSVCTTDTHTHTGGGTGIGRAVCQQLAREGASVAVAGNILSDCQETVSHLQSLPGSTTTSSSNSVPTFHPMEVDVSCASQVTQLFQSMARNFTGNF